MPLLYYRNCREIDTQVELTFNSFKTETALIYIYNFSSYLAENTAPFHSED
jgi:hypothetical protein